MAALAAATLALSLTAGTTAQAAQPLDDPIPEQTIQSGLGLVLTQFATFPQSTPTPEPIDPRLMRRARINAIVELPDRSGRMAVPDLNGMLYLVRNGKPEAYLDVGTAFAPQFFSGRGLGQGFGYVAFHPDFARNGRFYTVHTELATSTTVTPDYAQSSTGYHGVITEWTAKDSSANTFRGTHREVLRIGFTGRVHGIQQIDFNSTARRGDRDYGLLYLAVGDGGQGATKTDPQNLAMPHGKILRIDPDGSNAGNGRYGIPNDNPFVSQAGALGEIYALGMRDPHRFSWDSGPGHRLFLGHIGEHTVEAVYDVRAGDNLGWSEREGSFVFDRTAANPCDRILPLPADDAEFGYTYPVAAYDHDPPADWDCSSDVGRAVSGGFVHRGRTLPELRGKYVFGDLVDGRVFYTEADEMRRGHALAPLHELMLFDDTGRRVVMPDLSGPGAPGDQNRVDLRFGRSAAGDLYLLSKANGKIWKVTDTKTFASGDVGNTRLRPRLDAKNWAPVTPALWQFSKKTATLAQAGQSRPGPRRPFEYAVLTDGPAFGAVEIEGKVRLDTPVEITNRDVIMVFGYRSDTEFYYVHLSSDNKIYPHNGIFVVNNADRLRIDDQWDGSRGAPPAITDSEYHKVRVVHLPSTGEIAVYVDGSKDPLMTATDTTFGSGRVGFGSFDNTGSLRNLRLTGTPATS
ncbi:PQQ-dependent sugar dehydrogenase [Kineosporia babensis]|uniref:PQQ-dependent sugar dehydrogenase n=1 Tax=Kineosporia babensis TaxID=499548 RepID=A0A9X1STQ5_9ACTN|nr:PQQ-dependent sugar dehydrogenase [Kineosporia babensis]